MNSFVYFDLGGVLIEWKQAFPAIAEHFKTTPEHVRDVWFQFEERLCTGQAKPAELHKRLCEEAKFQYDPKFNLSHFACDTFTRILPMVDFVHECAANHRIGLLTNVHLGALDYMVTSGKVDTSPFETVVDSSRVGFAKPGKRIFEVAEEVAGASAEQIFFIDDSPGHLAAAAAQGWTTFHFDGADYEESISAIRALLAERST